MLIVIASKQAGGCQGIAIDQCRIDADDAPAGRSRHGGGRMQGSSWQMPDSVSSMPAGRWPANVLLTTPRTNMNQYFWSDTTDGIK